MTDRPLLSSIAFTNTLCRYKDAIFARDTMAMVREFQACCDAYNAALLAAKVSENTAEYPTDRDIKAT